MKHNPNNTPYLGQSLGARNLLRRQTVRSDQRTPAADGRSGSRTTHLTLVYSQFIFGYAVATSPTQAGMSWMVVMVWAGGLLASAPEFEDELLRMAAVQAQPKQRGISFTLEQFGGIAVRGRCTHFLPPFRATCIVQMAWYLIISQPSSPPPKPPTFFAFFTG